MSDRPITLISSPGHHRASVNFYDPVARILFTGDNNLPGRLSDMAALQLSGTWDRLRAGAR